MSRILTGIQSTGKPHLGNILGAILPAIELSHRDENDAIYFIADLHSLTTVRDPKVLKENTLAVAAAWLAFGLDTNDSILFRQSDVTEVCELTWYLNCFTPYPMLANAHSFKDKSSRLNEVNVGLFDYPVLMAADILLYDSEFVPVGKDQKQHLEITRDIAGSFNHAYGETLVLPEALINEKVMVVPGTDGQKMSKSYNNYIDIFQNDKALRKQVMTIVTDAKSLEEPKDPDTCNVFRLYELLAMEAEIEDLRAKYLAGNFGYGHAKDALFQVICKRFEKERNAYEELMATPALIENELSKGALRAKLIAGKVIKRVREKVGY
ncbi:MAG: tryptophan--tRNA ligase [Flavobacteriales bacterium]|nr:tryptophan--tRNA ligase [Flavobacteriales bacterium]MCB9449264.1 tryptophan--tRNA ligase [Flavobacteriales bacterium]